MVEGQEATWCVLEISRSLFDLVGYAANVSPIWPSRLQRMWNRTQPSNSTFGSIFFVNCCSIFNYLSDHLQNKSFNSLPNTVSFYCTARESYQLCSLAISERIKPGFTRYIRFHILWWGPGSLPERKDKHCNQLQLLNQNSPNIRPISRVTIYILLYLVRSHIQVWAFW